MKLRLLLLSLLCVAGCKKPVDPKVEEENARREAFGRALVLDAGGVPAMRITSTNEVHFESGFSPVQFDPPNKINAHAFRFMGKRGLVRLRSKNVPMKLRVAGWVDQKALHTNPEFSLYIDGVLLARKMIFEDGFYAFDEIVPPEMQKRPWIDLEIVPSSVAFHWAEPPELKVIVCFDVQWKE